MDTRNAGAAGAGLLALLIGAGGNDIGMPPDPVAGVLPTIVVIGGGVRGTNFTTDLSKLPLEQRSSGAAMAIGIVATLSKHLDLQDRIRIEWRDDHNSMQEAAHIARELAAKRHVLAVIGFTQSSTAAAALPILAEAGIPVVLPIATSVELGRSPTDGTKHTDWVVHRTIADDAVQALALERAITDGLEAPSETAPSRRVMLLREVGADAAAYVDALAYMLEQRIDSRIVARLDIDRMNWDCDRIAAEAAAHNADVACFLGYPEMGRCVLFSLAPTMLSKYDRTQPLPLVMPDACCRLLTETLPNRNFLVTFPTDATPEQGQARHLSYEKAGQEAAKQILEAIKNRRKEGLSRKSLRSALKDTDPQHSYWVSSPDLSTLRRLDLASMTEIDLEQLRSETAARAGRRRPIAAEDRR